MAAPADHVQTLPLNQIRPSALNPRRSFNATADAELLESIRTHGILTPILVRPVTQHDFEVVAGHRRLAAAQELGLEAVPVTVHTLTDDQARETAIVENLQREDLAPLDEAESYQALLAIPGASPASVAAAVGKSPAYIGRRLKLLTLVPDAQVALRDGRMDAARAELLAKLTPELQATALEEAVWMPLYTSDDKEGTAETLEPLSDLREWVDRRTKLDLADRDALALFPDADELVKNIAEKSASSPIAPPLEIALDRFGISPAKDIIPSGVLRLNKDFRQVVGKKCTFASRAIVVFGQCRGDVVTVCTAKKSCTTHWPPKEKAGPAAKADRRPSWEEQERERKRVQLIWERVKPDVEKVIIAASAKVKTTPKLLQEILNDRHFDLAGVAIKAIGKLTPDTFGRAWVLVEALSDLYAVDGAERALKAVNGFFDVKKAMKAAEAAMAAEQAVSKAAAKAETRTPGAAKSKPAKKRRAT